MSPKSTLLITQLLVLIGIGWAGAETPIPHEPPAMAYEAIVKWHQSGGLAAYSRPKKYRLDLNGDQQEEVLLAISGYGRGMLYALFTNSEGKWILLSSNIRASHTTPDVLPAANSRWHDFLTLRPTGHGTQLESIYTWNGKEYVEKSEHIQ